MLSFLLGIGVLIIGGALYGRFCEKVMKPSDRKTPAVENYDGVDYVPMKKWKNSLIELLNIAGTGPILGPIQGILFGPIAFITIPIGCVIGGAFHDYMSGMISVRNGGEQMPSLVRRFLGKYVYTVYNVFVCLLLLLLGVVFIYTPGDIFITQIIGQKSTLGNPVIWIVYGVIFAYYIIAALLPIDKIIGRIYPIFGAILLLSAVGVCAGLFIKGYRLDEIWTGVSFTNPYGEHFIPIFFVTVACGIVSGFHSTQATLVSRTIADEREGRTLLAAGKLDDPMFRYAHQFAEADKIVISAPFWDGSFPSLLKVYIENIYAVGIVSRYSENGTPVGMCRAEELVYVTTAGGPYFPEFSFGYIKTVAETCFGIKSTRLVKAEMLDIDGMDAEKILLDAMNSV